MASVHHAKTKGKKLAKPARNHFGSPLDKARGDELDWPHTSPVFESARRISNPRYVYFIGEQDDGPLKIGVAKDPIARLRGMQTGNPRRLKVERVLVGDMNIEKLLHDIWEEFVIVAPKNRGKVDRAPCTEWFRAEIREKLYPVIATALVAQMKILTRGSGAIELERLEHVVRVAHTTHDIELRVREQVRLLAVGSGYVYRGRRSRI